jgi:hypothetical protein
VSGLAALVALACRGPALTVTAGLLVAVAADVTLLATVVAFFIVSGSLFAAGLLLGALTGKVAHFAAVMAGLALGGRCLTLVSLGAFAGQVTLISASVAGLGLPDGRVATGAVTGVVALLTTGVAGKGLLYDVTSLFAGAFTAHVALLSAVVAGLSTTGGSAPTHAAASTTTTASAARVVDTDGLLLLLGAAVVLVAVTLIAFLGFVPVFLLH